MWDLAVREEDYAEADSLLHRKFPPDKLPLGHRALLAIVRRDSAGRKRILDEVEKQTSGNPFAAPGAIALYLNDFTSATEFAQAALKSPRPPAAKGSVHQTLALLALAQGRWTAAKPEFAQAEPTIPSAKRLHALSATWPFLAVPGSDLAALRTELEAWNPNAEAPEPNPGLASALRPQVRLYLLGLLSSRHGDDAHAFQYATELEGIGHPPEAATLVRDLARTVRADVALRRGHPADALKLLEPVRGEVPPELLALPFFSEEGSRYLRAEALFPLGRDEAALRWFTHAFEGTPSELVYLAPAHLRQAELYERLGDRKQAVEHYSRFIQLWNSCDPELGPRVEEAKARLASLVGEPR
jgi:tetratricopeptide (TPR) repeat protein